MSIDSEVRLAAFNWLREQVSFHGEVLPRKLLERGFDFQGHRVPLVAPNGIFKPKIMSLPLTITTTPNSKYDDSFNSEGFLNYRYRGTNPEHPDNVGLRKLMQFGEPLIYFHGVIPGKYLVEWPVYIIGDNPKALSFTVAVDEKRSIYTKPGEIRDEDNTRRAYITQTVRARLHQKAFRERVLDAYRSQCALCRLRHVELLDAAHIIPDSEPESTANVDNGLSLCKLHHAAFDSFIVGITPDYEIIIRKDVLEEEDGPMLQHGLKELHHSKIILPNSFLQRPQKDFLDWKYQKFRDSI